MFWYPIDSIAIPLVVFRIRRVHSFSVPIVTRKKSREINHFDHSEADYIEKVIMNDIRSRFGRRSIW